MPVVSETALTNPLILRLSSCVEGDDCRRVFSVQGNGAELRIATPARSGRLPRVSTEDAPNIDQGAADA